MHDEDTLHQAIDYAVKLRRVGLVNKLRKLELQEHLDGQEKEVQLLVNEVAGEETTAPSQEIQDIDDKKKCYDLLIDGETFEVRSCSMCTWGHKSEGSLCIFNHKIGVSLVCPKSGCNFATQPESSLDVTTAKIILEQHLRKSHKIGSQIKRSKPKARKKSTKEESTCPICFKLFDKKSNMSRHVKQEHEQDGRYECDKCEKSYAAKISLNYHKKTQHSDKTSGDDIKDDVPDTDKISSPSFLPQKCEICGMVMQGKSSLNRHCREVHHLETRLNLDKVDVWKYPFKCDKCPDRFQRQFTLTRHKKLKHSEV